MSLRNKEILIVDDNPDLLFIMQSILRHTNATFHEAQNVADAYRIYQQGKLHLILCDLGMRPESGFDFLRLVQAKEFPVPVLVLSAEDSPESVSEAIALGAADYLVKPIETPILLQKIQQWIL